jgi:hypothetical protein
MAIHKRLVLPSCSDSFEGVAILAAIFAFKGCESAKNNCKDSF